MPSLAVRDGLNSPAGQLSVERARSVVPGFAPDGDADAIAEICRRLDGIPLAIEFSQEQLGATEDIEGVRQRHAAYFADTADAMFELRLRPRQLDAYEWLDQEMDNLRAAFHWAADGPDPDVAIRIAASIGDLARFRLRYEATEWAARIAGAALTLQEAADYAQEQIRLALHALGAGEG